LGTRGRAYWRDIMAAYDMSRTEVEQLVEACRQMDLCEDLQAVKNALPSLEVLGSEGQPRIHPVAQQLNSARAQLHRLLGALDLPDLDGGALPSPRSVQAQRAAQARWRNHTPRSAS
jgi:hypothetical protein